MSSETSDVSIIYDVQDATLINCQNNNLLIGINENFQGYL